MIGKIFITSSGYDPEKGKHVKDPYLGEQPSLGACRHDIRRRVERGDWIFTLSGKVRGLMQFVMGGFEVANKIAATDAYAQFPRQRLHRLPDGQLAGNVCVNANGGKHRLDRHPSKTFARRMQNYVVGTNPVVVRGTPAITRARAETLDILREVFERDGDSPIAIFNGNRWGATMDERQVLRLLDWLTSVAATNDGD